MTASVSVWSPFVGRAESQFNLVRCLIGAAAVALVQPINDRLQPGWTFVLIFGICWLSAPLILVVYRKGPAWRLQRIAHAKAKARRAEEAEKAQQPRNTFDIKPER